MHLLNQFALASLSILRCAAPVICCIIKLQGKLQGGEILIAKNDNSSFGSAAHRNIKGNLEVGK
jgi:hypothetical protein